MEKHYDLSTIRYFANKVKILKLCEKLAQRETRWGIISWRMTKVSRRTVIHLLEEEIQERKFSKKTLSKKYAPKISLLETPFESRNLSERKSLKKSIIFFLEKI